MHWLGSPPNFYRFAGAWRPWLMAAALIAGAIGLYGGLGRRTSIGLPAPGGHG